MHVHARKHAPHASTRGQRHATPDLHKRKCCTLAQPPFWTANEEAVWSLFSQAPPTFAFVVIFSFIVGVFPTVHLSLDRRALIPVGE